MADLPAPLTPADCDLREFPRFMLDVSAISEMAVRGSANGFRAGFWLMLESWHQLPAASVANDQRILSRLSGADRQWWRVCDQALSGFVLCSDGRWYHPMVAERANHVWAIKQRLLRRQIRRLEMDSGEWAALRVATFERDKYTCVYCGVQAGLFEADHVVPVDRGGLTTLHNLATACRPCNRSKGAKDLAEWTRWRAAQQGLA